jgi:hypothetical protein
VEIFSGCLWIILWKTLQVFLSQNLQKQKVFTSRFDACAKASGSGAKKNKNF